MIAPLIQYLKFLTLASQAYRLSAGNDGVIIRGALARNGICYMTVYVALDRNAWQLDDKMDTILENDKEEITPA